VKKDIIRLLCNVHFVNFIKSLLNSSASLSSMYTLSPSAGMGVMERINKICLKATFT
jgi:hypothetical protein